MRKFNIVLMTVVVFVILAAAVIALTHDASKYESEDAKLKEYALQTHAAIRQGLREANVAEGFDEGEVNQEAFRYVEDYIELYQTGIDSDELTEDAGIFYNQSLVALRPYDEMVDAADDMLPGRFEQKYEDIEDSEDQFLRVVAEYYGNLEMYEDYDSIEEFSD